jgi:hypothetical protein
MVHGEFCSAEIFCNTYIGAAPETGGGKGAEAKLSTPLSTTTAECDTFALPLWIFGGGAEQNRSYKFNYIKVYSTCIMGMLYRGVFGT